ncbi:MAG: hypothetical protein GY820_34720, partial [Gammaproteobacteria bacterium]|nr:hypothetical protein [Gammaproteobacteria bacterium]
LFEYIRVSPEVKLDRSGANTHFSGSRAGRGPYTAQDGIGVTAGLTWTGCTLIRAVAVDSVGSQVFLESPQVDCEQIAFNESSLGGEHFPKNTLNQCLLHVCPL